MADSSKLTSARNATDTSEVLGQTAVAITEGLTGILTSDRKDFIRSIGFILQRLRGRRFIETLKAEWDKYREKGRVKDDYLGTDQHGECLQEMLDFLDGQAPDQRRFDILKKILLVAASEENSSRESILPQQYMRLVREMSSGEVVVLLTTYTVAKSGHWPYDTSAVSWLGQIAKESGLQYPDLVAFHEERLIVKNLLTPRILPDHSGVTRQPHNRLTELGYQLCEFISHYSPAE